LYVGVDGVVVVFLVVVVDVEAVLVVDVDAVSVVFVVVYVNFIKDSLH